MKLKILIVGRRRRSLMPWSH